MSIGIPIKVFHEAKGLVVTLELKTGEVYRGTLGDTEDNMNCQMTNITYTARDGRVASLEQVYIRGSKIRFIILPDMLKNAPMFKNLDPKKTGTVARGKGLGVQKGKPLCDAAVPMINFLCLYTSSWRSRHRARLRQRFKGRLSRGSSAWWAPRHVRFLERVLTR